MDDYKIVEEFLEMNKDKKYSVKTIAKRTGLRTKQVTYMCHHSNLVRQIDPLEVGSLKTQMNVFAYKM